MDRETTLNKQNSFNNSLKCILMAILCLLFLNDMSSQIIFESSFENGSSDWGDSGVWKQVPANAISSTDSREGVKSVRFLPVADDKRSEFTIRNGLGTFYWGEEYWVGFSLKVIEPLNQNGWKIISQHHSTPHLLSNGNADWSCTAGPNSFIVLAVGSNFAVRTSTNSSNVNTVPTSGSASWGTEEVLSPFQLHQWYDFVLHFRYALDATGFIEIWINGDKIINKQNMPTVYKYDLCGELRANRQYQKIGMYYGPNDNQQGGEILYDAFRIGNQQASYNDVVPEGNVLEINEFDITDLKISPNPIKNNEVHVHTSGTFLVKEIRIYDILGKEVFSENVQSSEKKISLKANLSKGIYIIRMNTEENGSISKKIIIE